MGFLTENERGGRCDRQAPGNRCVESGRFAAGGVWTKNRATLGAARVNSSSGCTSKIGANDARPAPACTPF